MLKRYCRWKMIGLSKTNKFTNPFTAHVVQGLSNVHSDCWHFPLYIDSFIEWICRVLVWNFVSLTNTKTVQWIHELLQVNGTFWWRKELVVAAPWWLLNLKNRQALGHKLNETLKCILSQHWFPEFFYERNSMAGPWLNIRSMFSKVLEVFSWSPLVPLGIQTYCFKWLAPWAALNQPIGRCHIRKGNDSSYLFNAQITNFLESEKKPPHTGNFSSLFEIRDGSGL